MKEIHKTGGNYFDKMSIDLDVAFENIDWGGKATSY
jgi:hypothetical protein